MSDYGFVHNGKTFTPNETIGVTPEDNDTRNRAIEEAELAEWRMRPQSMLAYYSLVGPKQYRADFRTHGTVSTWLGTTLGDVVEAHVYPHNFGSRMVSLRVRATNGAEYYGRASYDWGSCVVLRRVKARKGY